MTTWIADPAWWGFVFLPPKCDKRKQFPVVMEHAAPTVPEAVPEAGRVAAAQQGHSPFPTDVIPS